MVASCSFGSRNFADVNLGDRRRTKRLVQLVDAICRHTGGSLPDKLPIPADLRAFYRLMNCDRVTHEVLMDAHTDATRRELAQCVPSVASPADVVLVLHDATELDYTSKKSLTHQLGQIGQGTRRGYICHNSLAVRLIPTQNKEGVDTVVPETLGLLSQILHHRADVGKETHKEARERESRESRLWRRGVEACGLVPPGVVCIDVSDSLSDVFEYMAYEVTYGRQFVLRAKENRTLAEPINEHGYLFDAVRSLPSVGERTVTIQASPGRAARTAKVQIAFTKVRIAPPGRKSGDYEPVPLELWAVRVWESNTPKGEEPLEWILLTNCPVNDRADAGLRIDWYGKRWIVEEYHKGMKTGCSIESMQFELIERLEPAIAILSVTATTLLRLRDAVRAPDADTRPATEVVDAVYVDALASCYPSRMKGKITVLKFYMHVARLGGHQNRKCDGLPGWLTLWRGWTKLDSIVMGYTAQPLTCGKT